jgi:hypothetical protein
MAVGERSAAVGRRDEARGRAQGADRFIALSSAAVQASAAARANVFASSQSSKGVAGACDRQYDPANRRHGNQRSAVNRRSGMARRSRSITSSGARLITLPP